MFDKSKIVSNMYGIVGLRQPYNTSYAILDATNIASRSGFFSNDNAFVKVEFLYDCQNTATISNTQFNTLVKQMQCAAINDVCNEVFNEADYVDRNFLFTKPLNKSALETLPDGFVGYELEIEDDKNVAFEISRCRFNFSGTGTVKLLLFSEHEENPIQSKVVTINNSNIVEDLKWVVDGSGNNYKGSYFLGYLTNSLTGGVKPYKRDYEDSTIMNDLSFLEIEPMSVPDRTTEKMWDRTTEEGNGSCYFGINPDITVFYDYTDLILRNEKLLAKAIDISFQIKIMQTYIATSRTNRNERISDDLISKAMAEIEGLSDTSAVTKKGLKYLLFGEIRAIRKEIQKLRDGYFLGNNISVITLT